MALEEAKHKKRLERERKQSEREERGESESETRGRFITERYASGETQVVR